MAALIHFGVYYWRALMLSTAASDLSERIRSLMSGGSVGPDDFAALICLREMCPDLDRKSRRLGAVAAYYRVLSLVRSAMSSITPIANWANAEMAACSRYVAVITDQRMQGNLAQVAQIHSY